MTAQDEEDIGHFTSQETDEWATPPEFVRPLAESIGGFDLDPASGAERSPVADDTYTEEENGLIQPWYGRVWVNPPYSEMDDWVRKAVSESKRDDVATILFLCKGDSSTDWWHSAVSQASAIAMLDGRLSFGEANDGAPFASHVLAFGDVPEEVLDTLARRGAVFEADDLHERSKQERIA